MCFESNGAKLEELVEPCLLKAAVSLSAIQIITHNLVFPYFPKWFVMHHSLLMVLVSKLHVEITSLHRSESEKSLRVGVTVFLAMKIEIAAIKCQRFIISCKSI